jgi:hypothetical protein
MALDIAKLAEAEREAERIVEEARVQAQGIRKATEDALASLRGETDRHVAGLRGIREGEMERELQAMREAAAERGRAAAKKVDAALAARRATAVQRVVREIANPCSEA